MSKEKSKKNSGSIFKTLGLFFLDISEMIGRWIHPNRYPLKELKKKKKKAVDKMTTQQIVDSATVCGVELEEDKSITNFENAFEAIREEDYDVAKYNHTENLHVVACKFSSGSYNRYQARSDKARKKLKPLLFPKANQPFDRTHVIPIGFHGSENNDILVVGWDSDQNRNAMRKFEDEAKTFNELDSIVWITVIKNEPTNHRAVWETRILTPTGNELLEKQFVDNHDFVWKTKK